ncbi:hypothetical protein KDJ56_18725 [Brevibacillus composti]|uniref:Uncharacterized protein n=1 Tax=Brevibacillus composti TaxID=2796470 RepID=A0A7T5EJT2_9BACL|nr:hypothetical protein [Brevibacillus composti]QQE73883.1 hypothetical protein JD108_18785 [Brevibacillus composti]QUO40968.1 hypothetical protein KDJ56_18725 [Brevibacillus composti]
MTEEKNREKGRPDTSKNGMLKRRELDVRDEAIKERGKGILSRLGKKKN